MKTVVLMFALGGGAFAQTTLNASEDLVRLGIASVNIVPNEAGQDTGPPLFHGGALCKEPPVLPRHSQSGRLLFPNSAILRRARRVG